MNSTYSQMCADDTETLLKMETFTPERAFMWATDYRFDLQRPLNLAQVKRLAGEIVGGRWNAAVKDAIIVAVTPTGLRVIDGQHRLAAIIEADRTVSAKVEYWRIASESEIPPVYADLEYLKRGRTARDGIFSMGTAGEIGVSLKLTACALSGLRTMARGFGHRSTLERTTVAAGTRSKFTSGRSHDVYTQFFPNAIEQDRVLKTWGPQIYALSIASGGGSFNIIKRKLWHSTVSSVALATIRWQPETAMGFWRDVSEMDSPKGSAAHTLFAYLSRMDTASSAESVRVCAAIASCWNAHFQDRRLASVGTLERAYLLGTPFDRECTPQKAYLLVTEPEAYGETILKAGAK